MEITPDLDPYNLTTEQKIQLIKKHPELINLLQNTTINEDLWLNGCTSLTHIPEELKVKGSLGLGGCTSLTHIPEGLEVNGSLNLNGCTSLTHIPNDLEINRYLGLKGCTSLTHIPEGLKKNHTINMGIPKEDTGTYLPLTPISFGLSGYPSKNDNPIHRPKHRTKNPVNKRNRW